MMRRVREARVWKFGGELKALQLRENWLKPRAVLNCCRRRPWVAEWGHGSIPSLATGIFSKVEAGTLDKFHERMERKIKLKAMEDAGCVKAYGEIRALDMIGPILRDINALQRGRKGEHLAYTALSSLSGKPSGVGR